MTNISVVTVVVPSYNPDEKLAATVSSLRESGFTRIIVIDDGSSAETKKFFPEHEEGVILLRHEVNRGKGAGLKTAFRYILDNLPDTAGCITVDGDGQHKAEDVVKCAESMLASPDSVILGARDFSLPHVPQRSRTGNRITSRVFRLLFGMKISDTQTGLRCIPREYLEIFLGVKGDRYEYETNMLLEMKRWSIPFSEVMIETVYINENETSHFRPVRDSIRIYGLIIKFLFSSMLSAVIDIGLFSLFDFFFLGWGLKFGGFLAVALARVISSAVNYTVNRRAVFGRGGKGSVLRYYALALLILVLSGTSVTALTWLIPGDSVLLDTVAKAAVDLVLFAVSFRFQHGWVFKSDKGDINEK